MRFSFAVVAGLLVIGCAPPGGTTGSVSGPITGKPEDAVKAFVDAVDKSDAKTALDCLLIDNPNVASAQEFLTSAKMKLEAKDVSVKMQEPYLAVVSFTLDADIPLMLPSAEKTSADHVNVLYTQGKWRILASGMPTQNNVSIGAVATMLQLSGAFQKAHQAAQATSSLSNAKLIATSVMIYCTDADDYFPLASDAFDALQPYLKNKALLTAPGDPAGTVSYSFNEKVMGKNMTGVVNPATTVLLYEGKDHQLHFAHDGKAAVAFCDSSAKLITPEEAKTLNWDPSK